MVVALGLTSFLAISGCDDGPMSKAGSISLPAPAIPKRPVNPRSKAGSIRLPKPAQVTPPVNLDSPT